MNKNIKNIQTKILHKDWSVLKKLTYEFQKNDGTWETQVREAYDRGDGATILLYNPSEKSVILTSQFRIPTYLNGNSSGLMIEACAGKLDENEDPLECVIRESMEETGYEVKNPKKVFEVYMSPGSVTEKIHFYIAEVDKGSRKNSGGGLITEQENIDVIEIPLREALSMIQNGKIMDGKTIMLLQHLLINLLSEEKVTLPL
jgi:GDP-mannose pyrophosphatase NudK